MDDVKAELEEMEKDNIITKVKEGEQLGWIAWAQSFKAGLS